MTIKYIYILTSFTAGFSLMVFELVSARIAAPIVGSSVFTWTAVIGTTLLGLSIGSFIGGIVIDRFKSVRVLSYAMLSSSFFVFLVPLLVDSARFFTQFDINILGMVLLLSFYLFLIPSIMIGLLQPMILKLYADDFSKIGKEYGLLSAMWSTGSILGVFMTGFYFISMIGSSFTLHLVSALLGSFGVYFFLYGENKI